VVLRKLCCRSITSAVCTDGKNTATLLTATLFTANL
jgi:hypothetical protein